MTRGFRQINAGRGDTAVLALHSLGVTGASWQGMAARVPLSVFAFDQLAHGAQAATVPAEFDAFVVDAEAVLAQVPTARVHLLGHSIGGAVAAHLAARAGAARIASLTVVATPLTGVAAFADRAHAVADGGMENVMSETLARWFDEDAPAAAVQMARDGLAAMQPAGFDACWRALAGFRGYDALPQTDIPAQVMSFAADRSTPPHMGETLAETLRGGFAVRGHHVIGGAGHMGVLTHPEALAEALAETWQASVARAEGAA